MPSFIHPQVGLNRFEFRYVGHKIHNILNNFSNKLLTVSIDSHSIEKHVKVSML